MATPWYATRERFLRALDVAETARADDQIDQALAHGTAAVHGLLHRTLYPVLATRTFDWPNLTYSRAWRLWLDENDLIEVVSIDNGADGALVPGEYLLWPESGPPYRSVNIDRGTAAGWSSGATGPQGAIRITGLWGWANDEATVGTVVDALDAVTTTVRVSDGSGVGIGDLLRAGTERMVVLGRTWVDSTQNLAAELGDRTNDVALAVADGSTFHAGEQLLVGAERMLVVDVAGDTLVVKRAWRGSVLAAHTIGADVYVDRQLLVERGALGTTATAHLAAVALYRWVPPAGVDTLCLAEAMSSFEQQRTAYARTVGSGETERSAPLTPLRDAREQARTTYGRQARLSAI